MNVFNLKFILFLVGFIYLILLFHFTLPDEIEFKEIKLNNTSYRRDTAIFIVRTYNGHFDETKRYNIFNLIKSLQALDNSNWKAILVNTDIGDLPPLPLVDPRIIYFEHKNVNKFDEWVAGYDITDAVIESLRKSEAAWVVITNGDNTYEKEFLNNIDSTQFDIIISNFWSRYEVSGSVSIHDMSKTVCHKAALRPGFVDLGGVILSLSRFHNENLKFMYFGPINGQDGFMFTRLRLANWRVKHVNKCLFSHSPNPYTCSKDNDNNDDNIQNNHYWFTSTSSRDDLSHACWSAKEVHKAMINHTDLYIHESKSGIKLISYPLIKEKEIKLRDLDQQRQFIKQLKKRLQGVRGDYCKKRRWNLYRFDWRGYRRLNPHTNHLGQKDIINYFHKEGCIFAHDYPNMDLDYILARFPKTPLFNNGLEAYLL